VSANYRVPFGPGAMSSQSTAFTPRSWCTATVFQWTSICVYRAVLPLALCTQTRLRVPTPSR
jgi:hypothetical protein